MYNEESSSSINNNLSMEENAGFFQDQTDINLQREEQINTLQQENTKLVKKNENSISPASKSKNRRICKKCNFSKPHYGKISNQCKDCYRASLRVLSGNKLIDDFIESTQTFSRVCLNGSKLEFIPYEQFTNIEYLAKGGFSIIHRATWVDGPISKWNYKDQRYKRKKNHTVVLKILNNSGQMDANYLDELKNFFQCKKGNFDYRNLHRYLGITQDPETKNYIMVMAFAKYRDLHYFLNKEALSWIQKLKLLREISIGLHFLHHHQLIHRDLHSGNILINSGIVPTIADLGISKPANESSDKNAIYGIIPYVAPEVLKGGKFTHASDIYSFGMIIWEVISGCRPFSDRTHDEYLILDIINGLRPKISINTPQDLIELIEKCWHQDPEKRKFIEKITYGFPLLRKERRFGGLSIELRRLIEKANSGEINFPENIDTNNLPTKINDQAIYSSRSLTPLINKAQSMKLNSNAITDIMRKLNYNQTDYDSKAIDFDITKFY